MQPTTVANYRKAFAPSGAKDDPTDAEVILELLVRHRDKLKPLQPESADMRACADSSSGVAIWCKTGHG